VDHNASMSYSTENKITNNISLNTNSNLKNSNIFNSSNINNSLNNNNNTNSFGSSKIGVGLSYQEARKRADQLLKK
jgi:hypothetical protein